MGKGTVARIWQDNELKPWKMDRSKISNDPALRGKARPRRAGQPLGPQGPEVEAWLGQKRQARWHLHFVPTSSSWLNLVERWSTDLTERRLRRGVFTSVGALVEALSAWAASWDEDPKPFVWHKAAEETIEKVRRGRAALHQVKSATRG